MLRQFGLHSTVKDIEDSSKVGEKQLFHFCESVTRMLDDLGWQSKQTDRHGVEVNLSFVCYI